MHTHKVSLRYMQKIINICEFEDISKISDEKILPILIDGTLIGSVIMLTNNFTKKILGYYMGGLFPYCKTMEDLTKLLSELLKEMENRGFIFTCDFEYKDPNFCSCWND